MGIEYLKEAYFQCSLKKGRGTIVSFIPQKFAILGKIVKLKVNDKWTNGWRVEAVSAISMNEEDLGKIEKQHRVHRKASDI